MVFRLGFRAALPNSRPPKQAARPRLWATQAAVESLVIQRTSLFMVDGLGSLEGTSLNDVATRVEEFPLHVFARPAHLCPLCRRGIGPRPCWLRTSENASPANFRFSPNSTLGCRLRL